MSNGIQIGAKPQSIREARAGIMEILTSSTEQKTIRKALDAFLAICEVKNTNVSGCTFTMQPDDEDDEEWMGGTD